MGDRTENQVEKGSPNDLSLRPSYRPFRAAIFWDVTPGLKPRAESCSPFRTKTSVRPVRKIDSTSWPDSSYEAPRERLPNLYSLSELEKVAVAVVNMKIADAEFRQSGRLAGKRYSRFAKDARRGVDIGNFKRKMHNPLSAVLGQDFFAG